MSSKFEVLTPRPLCTVCKTIRFETLAQPSGFVHQSLTYFVESAESIHFGFSCRLCNLIWLALRHDHAWLKEIAATGQVRLWLAPRPSAFRGKLDKIGVVGADRTDFENMVWLEGASTLEVHESRKAAQGQLSVYGVKGMDHEAKDAEGFFTAHSEPTTVSPHFVP